MEHPLKKMRLFIWDFDGTLMDTYPVTFVAYLRLALADFGYTAPEAEIMEKMLVNTGHAVDYYTELYNLPQLRERYRFHGAHGPVAMPDVYPQVKDVLHRVRELGGINCIYTHRGADTFPMLEHGGLTELFDEIITPGHEGFATKPAPDAIFYLTEKYGVAPGETVIVGDLFFPESVQTGVELVPHLGGYFDAFGLVGFDLRQIGKDNNDIRAEFCPNKTV